jgi:hypothetical protein
VKPGRSRTLSGSEALVRGWWPSAGPGHRVRSGSAACERAGDTEIANRPARARSRISVCCRTTRSAHLVAPWVRWAVTAPALVASPPPATEMPEVSPPGFSPSAVSRSSLGRRTGSDAVTNAEPAVPARGVTVIVPCSPHAWASPNSTRPSCTRQREEPTRERGRSRHRPVGTPAPERRTEDRTGVPRPRSARVASVERCPSPARVARPTSPAPCGSQVSVPLKAHSPDGRGRRSARAWQPDHERHQASAHERGRADRHRPPRRPTPITHPRHSTSTGFRCQATTRTGARERRGRRRV